MQQRYFLLFVINLVLLLSNLSCTQQDSQNNASTKQGVYTHASFNSKQRGTVAYNVYLPPSWSKERSEAYPLLILLHGQGESEHTFLTALPAANLNDWINHDSIPEMVIVALRGGENTNEMQWYTDPNEAMITSNQAGELRAYCAQNFHTSMAASRIAVIGHSRGATGALNFALYFPSKFSAVVSSAFVSDYALDRLKGATDKNLDNIMASGIQIQLLIGNNDQYVLNNNRKGSPMMSAYFKIKGIQHDFTILENKSHRLSELWAYPTNLNYLQSIAKTWDSK